MSSLRSWDLCFKMWTEFDIPMKFIYFHLVHMMWCIYRLIQKFLHSFRHEWLQFQCPESRPPFSSHTHSNTSRHQYHKQVRPDLDIRNDKYICHPRTLHQICTWHLHSDLLEKNRFIYFKQQDLHLNGEAIKVVQLKETKGWARSIAE